MEYRGDNMSKMVLFTLRIEPESVDRIGEIAAAQHLPVRTMMRSWLLQRLDEELKLISGVGGSDNQGNQEDKIRALKVVTID